MTTRENYEKLKNFLRAFPRNIEAKKDLLKLKDKQLLKDYYLYRAYFKIDRRLKPANVIKELKKFKRKNIFFKSEELGIDLTKHKDFDFNDKYNSSRKLIAIVTDAMLDEGLTLNSISSEYRSVDIRYNVTQSRKVVVFDTVEFNLEFMNKLPDDIYINISRASGGYSSAYNKNGLDFIYDYHNQSNDFAVNLMPMIEDVNLFIYRF